jgi:hypothetical protein
MTSAVNLSIVTSNEHRVVTTRLFQRTADEAEEQFDETTLQPTERRMSEPSAMPRDEAEEILIIAKEAIAMRSKNVKSADDAPKMK